MRILEGYGLTEGTCVSSVNPPAGERKAGSIGLRIPLQHMRAVMLNSDGSFDRRAMLEEVGVIAIKGPNVFSGYLDPGHNEALWITIGGERWLNTGDLGRQDADGYFWLAGRKKELIIRGGHNIDPKGIRTRCKNIPRSRSLRRSAVRPLCRRGAGRLRSIETRRFRLRGRASRVCRRPNSGTRRNSEARQGFVLASDDSAWKDLQTRAPGA